MKKTVLGFALVATTVLAATVSSQTVEAKRAEDTDVTIGFEKGGDGEGPWAKNLNIAKYPSELDFGRKNKIGESGAATIDLKATGNETEYLAVMDDREDNSQGWTMYARATDLEDVKDKSKKLEGKINLTFQKMRKYNMKKVGNDFELSDPDVAGNVEDLSTTDLAKYEWYSNDLTVPLSLELGDTTATEVVSAVSGTSGAVISKFDTGKLLITKGATKNQNYAGKIEWRLSTAYKQAY